MFTFKRQYAVFALCTAALAILKGCVIENAVSPDITQGGKLFVAESDYTTGLLEWMSVDSNSLSPNSIQIASDAYLRSYGGFLYVIESYGTDNILKFDPSKSDESGVIYQQHLGDNWNPVDMDFVSDTKAYVSIQNEPRITIFNPSTGKDIGSIDISAYIFHPDTGVVPTSPYANQMVISGGKLYVALQRRNGWYPGGNTIIVVVDTQSDSIVDTIHTQYKNNFDLIVEDSTLYVSNQGDQFVTGDGAIEAVTISSREKRVVITEETLGGNPNQIVHKEGTRFYVQNYVGWMNVQVVEVDFATGVVIGSVPNVKDAFGSIYFDKETSRLFVSERDSTEAGIKVFENNQQVGSTIQTSLPPYSIVVVR